MSDSEKSLFELRKELSTYSEGSHQHKYYSEQFEKRRTLLEALGAPYFEEIKRKTEVIQKILKDNGYENIDLLLKSLIIGGIEFFLNNDVNNVSVYDNNRIDNYYLGLFSSLHIDINDEKFLREILSELKKTGENLHPSPIEFLVKYNYKENNKGKLPTEPQKSKIEEIDPKNSLDAILEWFRESDYRNRLLKVGDPTPEYTFVQHILDDIGIILGGEELEYKEKSFLKGIGVEIDNKELLEHLQENLKSYITNFFAQKGVSINEDYFEGGSRDILYSKRREEHKKSIIGKNLLPGHYVFDDSIEKQLKYGENVIKYEIGDEYIPIDNCCVKEIGTILDANLPCFNLTGAYDLGDRFIVEKPTYSEFFKYDRESIKCWLVNVRSQKTGKVYRALSK